jgi:uncharacterized membrane protein
MVLSSIQTGRTIITLLPNRSASWAETRVFLYVICGTTLAIGTFWALSGAWMVLPFSGIEATLVAYVFYRVCQATYQRQVITCSHEQVLVQFGAHFPKRSWVLERDRVRLAVTAAAHHLEGPRLNISDANHSIELGHFLNKEDKEAALLEFKKAGLHVRGFNQEGSRTI